MNVLERHGHHVVERGLGEGIVQYVITEHSDGLVGSLGSHFTPLSALAEIEECSLGHRPASWCKLERSRVDELAADRSNVVWR